MPVSDVVCVTRPYIFVTNGGGKSEEERCLDLSRQLELEVSPGQFICGHTPMRDMAERYHTVLVVGGVGEKCRVVAEMYGFKDVITPGDIIKTRQDTTPFRSLTDDEFENSRVRDLNNTKIDAIDSFGPKPIIVATPRDESEPYKVEADVLLAADGIKSNIRVEMLRLLNVDAQIIDTQQAAYRIMIHRDQIKDDPELLALLDSDTVVRWSGAKRHIIAYAVDNKNIYNPLAQCFDSHRVIKTYL